MRVILIVLALLLGSVPAALAGLVPTAGLLPRPSFPAPVRKVVPISPLSPRLELVSSTYADPGALLPQGPPRPDWAPRRYGKDPLQDVIQMGREVYLLYGPDGSTNRYVGVGSAGARSLIYALDFKRFLRPPSGGEMEGVTWAREGLIRDRFGGYESALFVSNSHYTYASATRGRNAYLTAVDYIRRRVIWRSPALVANARTFVLTDDLIVSGYGFTDEPDYLYLLDEQTGRVLHRLAVPSAPEIIKLRVDGLLNVRTYDHRLVVRIRR